MPEETVRVGWGDAGPCGERGTTLWLTHGPAATADCDADALVWLLEDGFEPGAGLVQPLMRMAPARIDAAPWAAANRMLRFYEVRAGFGCRRRPRAPFCAVAGGSNRPTASSLGVATSFAKGRLSRNVAPPP